MSTYRNRETGNIEVWDKKPSAGYDSLGDYEDSQAAHVSTHAKVQNGEAITQSHFFSGLGKIDWGK